MSPWGRAPGLATIGRHSHNHDTPVVPIRRGNQARPSAIRTAPLDAGSSSQHARPRRAPPCAPLPTQRLFGRSATWPPLGRKLKGTEHVRGVTFCDGVIWWVGTGYAGRRAGRRAGRQALTDVWRGGGGPGGSWERRSAPRSAGGALRRRCKTAPLSRQA